MPTIPTHFAEEIHTNTEAENEILGAWLNVLWMRPSSALMKTLEMKHFSRFLPFKEPAADLGCGDGTHGALICGTRFGADFDMYLSVQTMGKGASEKNQHGIHFRAPQKEAEYYKGADPFLYFDKKDYESHLTIAKKPTTRFAWGCDLAETLVEKAKLLDAYETVTMQNLAEPLAASDNSFRTIYSNVTYWMENKEALFAEQRRILTDDGVVIFMAQDPAIHETLALKAIVKNHLAQLGHATIPQWVEEIDRGRMSQTAGKLLSDAAWRALFNKTGFEAIYHGQVMSRDAYWQYDMDLRETFPSDSRLAHELLQLGDAGAELRRSWKQDRIEHFFNKWQQFYHDPENWQKNIPRTWNFYAIKKQGHASWADEIATKANT